MSDFLTDPRTGGLLVRPDEFEAIRSLLYEMSGISLNQNKREMVAARLARRVRHYQSASIADYLDRLQTDAAEQQEFVNCLTTNKTDFFRESHHFDYLRDTLLPRLADRRRVRVWSAGCSTGEEPYTLAMTLADHAPQADGWDVKILASDIDTAVLASAAKGVYPDDRLAGLSPDHLRRFFLRGTGANAGKVSVRPGLRDRIAFRRINLMDEPWPVRTRFDAIFCRNVVIYFDRPTQQRLFSRFAELLTPDGLLFLGHSENLHWMAETFTPAGPTVYRLRASADTPPPPAARKLSPIALPKPKVEEHTLILGDVKATRGPAVLKTLLGSCVAACLYDPETGVGGMNHFSLPGASDEGKNARYGAYAMELLITAIMKKGGHRDRLRAKVFGGAKVLNVESERLNVGAKNAEFVLQFLDDEGIPVVGRCLGGTSGLQVRFNPHTGTAGAKPLAGKELPPLVVAEKRFGDELTQKVAEPVDVELF
ncbi:MAG: hypothetical protein MUF18_14125 [Fimbriiglobus sp.]|nr:hypothetical protein [Fimbriiglobus sp.]